MNWIFETYSNVYNAAMMQDNRRQAHAAHAKDSGEAKKGSFLHFLIRG